MATPMELASDDYVEKFYRCPIDADPSEIPIMFDGKLHEGLLSEFPVDDEPPIEDHDSQYGDDDYLDVDHRVLNPLKVREMMDVTQYAFMRYFCFFRETEDVRFLNNMQRQFNECWQRHWAEWKAGAIDSKTYVERISSFHIGYEPCSRFVWARGQQHVLSKIDFSLELNAMKVEVKKLKAERIRRIVSTAKGTHGVNKPSIHAFADYVWLLTAAFKPFTLGMSVGESMHAPLTTIVQKELMRSTLAYEEGRITFNNFCEDVRNIFFENGPWSYPFRADDELYKFCNIKIRIGYEKACRCLVTGRKLEKGEKSYVVERQAQKGVITLKRQVNRMTYVALSTKEYRPVHRHTKLEPIFLNSCWL